MRNWTRCSWLILILNITILASAHSQCTLADCAGGAIVNVNPPQFLNNTFIFDYVEIGNIYCSNGVGTNTGMFVQIYELLPDGSRVFNCGSFAAPPDNYIGSIPIGFGDGTGCGVNFQIFDSASPLEIGPAQGLQQCDGAVLEVQIIFFVDSSGTLISSTSPSSDIELLPDDQKEVLIFGPYHNVLSGDFPSSANGGPLVTNTIDNWNDVQNGNSSGGEWSLSCDEDIELFIQATSFLTQCDPYDFSNGLPSELSNTLTYSINGQLPIDIIANAGLPSSGGIITGLDPYLGFCYGGIYTEFSPTVIEVAEINPEPGDEVSIILTTSDIFTSDTLYSEVNISYECYVTPVELISFTAQPKNKLNLIEWITVSETENDYFIIEKSSDGNIFSEIAIVYGAGTSSDLQKYSYKDFNISSQSDVFYRLIQTDYNGNQEYSEIISLSRENDSIASPCVRFNQTEDFIEVFGLKKLEGPISLSLISMDGSILDQSTIEIDVHYSYNIPINRANSGLYLLKISHADCKQVIKLFI